MSNNNGRNQIMVPNAREAMDTFMMEAANELGDRSRFSASHHTVSYRFMS